MFVIYETTNLINGKKYIGLDSHNNPNYYDSGTLFVKSLKKYGKDANSLNIKPRSLCEVVRGCRNSCYGWMILKTKDDKNEK